MGSTSSSGFHVCDKMKSLVPFFFHHFWQNILSNFAVLQRLPETPCWLFCVRVSGQAGIELIFQRSWYGAAAWISDENNVDTTTYFSYYWAVLTLSQGLWASRAAPPAMKVGARKKLGGGTARAADINWPERYLMPHGIMLNNKTEGSWLGGGCHYLRTGWALFGEWWAIVLCITCLF